MKQDSKASKKQRKSNTNMATLYIYHTSFVQVNTCRHYGGKYDDLSATQYNTDILYILQIYNIIHIFYIFYKYTT